MRISKVVILMLIFALFTGSAFAEDRVSLAFLYGSTSNIDLIDRTNGSINQVSPTCFDLDNKGNLAVTGNLTHEFVEEMHNRGIKVTPFLSNHWSRQKGVAAVNNAENLSNQIIQKIEEYNLDGVNVDIENLTPDHKDLLTNLVVLLNQKMPEEKILSVSVAANPTGKTTGWQGSYDYEALGMNSDYLLLMTYDEHSQGGPEGPVSSHEFVENSIIYATNYVEKDKLVLGIPFFGRYWKLNENTGEYSGGKAVVIGAMPGIIERHKGIAEYDETIGEAKLTIVVNNAEMSSRVNGEDLEDGEYVFWYPNHEAIQDKLALVNQYDLLGSGVWALGQEKVDVWAYYKDNLNKNPRFEEAQYAEVESDVEVKEFEFASSKYDLTPISEAIIEARKVVKEFIGLEFSELLDTTDAYEEVPHKHEEFYDGAEFAKVKEKTVKNTSGLFTAFMTLSGIVNYHLCLWYIPT